jgi:hypothetical protein
MIKAWQAGSATIVVALLTSTLIVLDLSDGAFRRWWSSRAFTTDAVGGLLVVLITVLIVNQVLRISQQRARSRAIAAQAAIVLGQAVRTTRQVSALGTNSGDRAAASDEVRTYMTMLMIAAPVLIDAKIPRVFLEQAQILGAQLAQTVSPAAKRYQRTVRSKLDLDDALRQLKIAAAPLISLLTSEERTATGGAEPAEDLTQEP